MDEQKLGEVIAGIDFLKGQVQRLDERVLSEFNRIERRLEHIPNLGEHQRLEESVQALWSRHRRLEARSQETSGIVGYTREILTVLLAGLIAMGLSLYL